MKYDVVIVGGGPAGVQAALSARLTSPEISIALIRREKIALIPCGIPYVIHTLPSVDDNILPDSILSEHDIEIIIGEVSGRDGSVLSLRDGRQLEFRKLVLAVGSAPTSPQIPGIDQPGVHILAKDYDSLTRLREAVGAADRALIVGGGYVGVELADELTRAGKAVTLVEAKSSLLPASVDPEFARLAQAELKRAGAEIITGAGVKALVGKQSLSGADLTDGRWITADLAIVAVGFQPSVLLAEKLGLKIDHEYGVVVDEYLRTSDPDIFAVGDCAIKRSCYTGELQKTMLASTAISQGRLAGSNLFSINIVKTFPGTIGTFCTKVGNLALGVTGLTETQARRLGLEYEVGQFETVDRHPETLPSAGRTTAKLIFARYSHLLLGAQMSGGESVGECINMLSVMIQKKMTAVEIDTLQIGTHPLLTASPLANAIIGATVSAIMKWYPAEHKASRRSAIPNQERHQAAT